MNFVIIVTTFHNQWDQNLCQLSCCLLAAIAALSAASFVMLLHLAASCNWILIKMRAKTPTREVLVGPVRTWPSSRPLWNRTKSCPDFLIVVLLLIFFLYFFHFLFRLLGLQTRPRAPLKNVDKCWQFFRQPLVINLIFLWPWPISAFNFQLVALLSPAVVVRVGRVACSLVTVALLQFWLHGWPCVGVK